MKNIKSLISPFSTLKFLLIATAAIQVALHFCIPLMPHFLNDPAWYFMFKEFLFNGTWIHEELYPSFTEPILYYNSLGYPLLIYVAQLISNLSGLSIAFIILQLQFSCYLASGTFIYLIIKEQGNIRIAGIIALIYFWFIPFFNYAHLLMSETMFICSLLSVILTFNKYLIKNSLKNLILAFVLLGLTFLIRPVAGVLFPSILITIIIKHRNRLLYWKPILCSLLFLAFPIAQLGFNKVVYSTYTLREGFAWNLWNRVVSEDGYKPELSDANKAMRLRLNDPSFIPESGHWWDITSQLSHRGLNAKEIQSYCMEVCIDGIQERPLAYIRKSVLRGFWELPTEFQETVCIYPTENEYKTFLLEYNSEHHKPLVNALLEQNFEGNWFKKFAIAIYSMWNDLSFFMSSRAPFIMLYIASLLSFGYILIKKKLRNTITLLSSLIVLTMLAMSLAACSFEVLHNRYYLPGIVMELIIIGQALGIYFSKNKSQEIRS